MGNHIRSGHSKAAAHNIIIIAEKIVMTITKKASCMHGAGIRRVHVSQGFKSGAAPCMGQESDDNSNLASGE